MLRWRGIGLAERETLAGLLVEAIGRDEGPDALPDSGEVYPLGDLPSLLWDTRTPAPFDLGTAPGRKAALASLREVEAEELREFRAARSGPRVTLGALLWSVADRLMRGERFAVGEHTASGSRPGR